MLAHSYMAGLGACATEVCFASRTITGQAGACCCTTNLRKIHVHAYSCSCIYMYMCWTGYSFLLFSVFLSCRLQWLWAHVKPAHCKGADSPSETLALSLPLMVMILLLQGPQVSVLALEHCQHMLNCIPYDMYMYIPGLDNDCDVHM